MFEFEIQGPRHVRLRVGRWQVRTWRGWLTESPRGYRSYSCYAVELYDSDDNRRGQVGAFTELKTAELCRTRLEAEGYTGVAINHILVHTRLADWEFDR